MNNEEHACIRTEKLSLLVGTILGQIANLLNQIKCERLSINDIYKDLLDITNSASIQVHEIYYKDREKKND